MQNRSGIVGNNNSVSRVVIFLIQKPYATQSNIAPFSANRAVAEKSFRLSRCTTLRNLRMILQAFCPCV